ncbi:MAG TPA: hypothetical protein VJC07_00455 [Candidatus Nanoarchaeia archaeon]|nr:hypothetical protein [Candidatus Nanoarchaeia archaeon]
METVRSLAREANQLFVTADHLAYVTYPLVNDTKLLVVVVDNLHKSLFKGMQALVRYDKIYKRIPPIGDDFYSVFEAFKTRTGPRYNFSRDFTMLMIDMNNLLKERADSPIEFRRRDHFVIASQDYKLRAINLNKVKEYVTGTKHFIQRLNEVITKK